MACQIALNAGVKYVWVDTCCIDKSNNVELTEAINAMYNWYQRLASSRAAKIELGNCRWFTRGWTLQELIAPNNIIFFDKDWNYRGSKEDLVDELSEITGITKGILQHTELLSSMSVAQRMSWAAHRETTRIEDTAYCLLGIFGVHMPLLYGSENQAFRCLQQEIMKLDSDFSIFAWKRPLPANQADGQQLQEYCGVLAGSPSVFSHCRSFVKGRRTHVRQEIQVSNGGITARMLLIELTPKTGGYRYLLPLDCSNDLNTILGVRLRKCGPSEFVRENVYKIEEFDKRALLRSNIETRHLLVDIEGAELYADLRHPHPVHNFVGQRRIHALQIKLPKEMWQHPFGVWPRHRYDGEDQAFFITSDSDYDSGVLWFRGSLTPPMGGLHANIDFDCIFCALGWSSTDIDSLQCTLLDQRPYTTALAAFHSDVSGWDYHPEQCLLHFIHHKIPRASSVRIQIPGTDTCAYVSFTASLVDDQSVCRDRFWRIEVSVDFYHGIGGVPQVEYGKWDLRHPSHRAENSMSNISTTESPSLPKAEL